MRRERIGEKGRKMGWGYAAKVPRAYKAIL